MSGSSAPNQSVPQQGSLNPDRHRIWKEDLESIRRDRELVSSTQYAPLRVVVHPRPASQVPATSANPGQTSVTSAAQGGQVIVLSDSDDDDSHDAGNVSTADVLAFYGQQGATQAAAMDKIKYQDQSLARQKIYPSRRNGLGFDMARLRRDMGWTEPLQSATTAAWDRGMYKSSPPLGFDEAVSRYWVRDAAQNPLMYGFPLVEEVVFFRPGNYVGARSACFFKALAYLVYGDHDFILRVQAEHLQYFGDVLVWGTHPRHRLYKRMNKKFYDTTITTTGGDVEAAANFFQLLSIPHAWMPLDMLDVTADLYNLFIVVYTIGTGNVITEVSTKGSYNARHVFLLFNGFHYQPMVPNEFLASEFTFPRVTYENVRSLPSSGDTDIGKGSIDLRWRTTWGQGLDRKKGALPIDHVFYPRTLRTAMTGSYPQQ